MSDSPENLDENAVDGEAEGSSSERPKRDRIFIIVAVILGAVIILSLICVAIFAATKIIPDQQKARETALAAAAATATRQQDRIQQSLTETSAAIPTVTPTFTLIPPTPTKAPSNTPLLAPSGTATSALEPGPATKTVIALKTLLASAQTKETTSTATPSVVPTTGFADEVGIPGLLGLSAVLLVVIFLARRMRASGDLAR